MKTINTILLFIITTSLFARQGINYKALIKDDLGNVVTNGTINIRFTIIDDSGPTDVYQETHTSVLTDTNGIVILNIGSGVPDLNLFADVDWSKTNSLKTEIDIEQDTTYEFLNTTQFMAVPYALSAANVTGLEIVTEEDSFGSEYSGWRLKGRNANNHAPIGLEAIDLSFSDEASEVNGSYGFYSLSSGYNTSAYGDFSVALGNGLKSEANNVASFGRFNIGGGDNFWVESDPLFEIGNGDDNDNRSNALTILKNGTVLAPSLDISEIIDNKSLITKEYADDISSTGLGILNEGGTSGWRLKGADPSFYGNVGFYAVDLSNSDTQSTTMGATGNYSIATGSNTTSSGDYSTAIGVQTVAQGNNSFSAGGSTKALGYTSVALGLSTIASGQASMSIGKYNEDISASIFTVGIGLNNNNRSNALTVLKNGNTGFGSITSPEEQLHLNDNSKIRIGDALISQSSGSLLFGSNDTTNVIGLWNDDDFSPDTNGGASLGISDFRWSEVWSVNGLNTTSDKRLKKDIITLDYGLKDILDLKPVSYKWKEGKQDTKLGFLAQDVEQVIPEIVKHTILNEDDKRRYEKQGRKITSQDTYAMNYSELIPVLTKAIQEQQAEIEALKAEVKSYKNIEQRLKNIEAKLNN